MQEKLRKQYEQWKSHGLEDEDLVLELGSYISSAGILRTKIFSGIYT